MERRRKILITLIHIILNIITLM